MKVLRLRLQFPHPEEEKLNIKDLKYAVLIIFAVAIFLLCSACSENTAPSQSPAPEKSAWSDIMDLSERRNVHLVVIGSVPADFDEVLEEINQKLVNKINTTISVKIISLSEWNVIYPLMLSGGEQIDLIYTAEWCDYAQEAMRNAFVELTEDFVRKYMPLSWEYTPETVWDQARISGKVYALPRTFTDNSSYGAVLIRDDILEMTGMKTVDSYDSYEEFLLRSAKLSLEGYPLDAFPSLPMVSMLMLPKEHMLTVCQELVWDTDNPMINADQIQFMYDTEEYKDFCLRMAAWAKAGVWPSNAISGTIHTFRHLEEGRSFSAVVRMHEAQNYLDSLEKRGYPASCYCILDDDTYVRKNNYSGDMISISIFSADPERAALCLDVLKNDKEINLLCQGGIEGRHYIMNPDGTRARGPEYADYIWSDWAWALRNEQFYPQEKRSEEVQKTADQLDAHLMPEEKWPFNGFHTDDLACEDEITVIRSLIREYEYSFNLGVFGDETEEKVAEFRKKLHDAGLDTVMKEWKAQADAWLKKGK